MKQTISLPIIHEANKKGLRLCTPYLEKVEDGFIVTWKYQATSFACQGQWSNYEVFYPFEDYDFNKAMQRLTDFIKREYREVL
jgi:hypothetical protein